MDLLGTDVRCIDAHAHLGNLEFDRSATRAMTPEEDGVVTAPHRIEDGFHSAGNVGHRGGSPTTRDELAARLPSNPWKGGEEDS